jgi:hypothetical protein
VCISDFLCFSVFLAIFQALQSLCLLFNVFQFSSHNPGQVLLCVFHIFHDFLFSHHTLVPAVFISHFPCFSVFHAIFQVKQCFGLVSTFFRFPSIFQVLQCSFLIFHLFLSFSQNFTSYSILDTVEPGIC